MGEEIVFNALIPELLCSDIEKSRYFYTKILGFEIKYERPEEKFCFLERGRAQLMIEQLQNGQRSWLAGALEKPFGRGMNMQIEVGDVDSVYETVQGFSCDIFMPMEEKWYDCGGVSYGNRQFIVKDPDGYLIRLYRNLGKRK